MDELIIHHSRGKAENPCPHVEVIRVVGRRWMKRQGSAYARFEIEHRAQTRRGNKALGRSNTPAWLDQLQ